MDERNQIIYHLKRSLTDPNRLLARSFLISLLLTFTAVNYLRWEWLKQIPVGK
jgi:hypothetical protein